MSYKVYSKSKVKDDWQKIIDEHWAHCFGNDLLIYYMQCFELEMQACLNRKILTQKELTFLALRQNELRGYITNNIDNTAYVDKNKMVYLQNKIQYDPVFRKTIKELTNLLNKNAPNNKAK